MTIKTVCIISTVKVKFRAYRLTQETGIFTQNTGKQCSAELTKEQRLMRFLHHQKRKHPSPSSMTTQLRV